MSESTTFKGSCLCNAVGLSASKMAQHYAACHCGMCRKWGGGPLLAVDCGSKVQIEGEESVVVFNSSDWAERGFCKRCGTHLFYRLKPSQEYHIPVGFFGDAVALELGLQVFVDRKPDSYAFANETKEMTQAQIYEDVCSQELGARDQHSC